MKSFRAAADRIVRQESALPSAVTRLLSGPAIAPRSVISDSDVWGRRLGALAALAQVDALTFVAVGAHEASRAYNLTAQIERDPAIGLAIAETKRSAAIVQVHTTVALADGRSATAILVAPLPGTEGVLLALRAGRSFAAADAHAATGIAEIVALELTREARARVEDADRRRAFILYELARIALYARSLDETLEDIATLLADRQEHDVAQIWLLGPDDELELFASSPRSTGEPIFTLSRDEREEVIGRRRVTHVARRTLWPLADAEVEDALLAPLADGDRSLGVLVLGRARDVYGIEDEEFARVLGRFVARVVLNETGEAERRHEAVETWEDEPALARE